MKRIRPLFVVLVTFAMTAHRVQSQAPAMDLASFGAPASSFLADSPLVAQLMKEGTFQRRLTATTAKGAAAAIVFSSNGQHTAIPSKLALAYPAGQRAQVEQLFNALLDAYPKIEATYKIPHNDLAGAVAVSWSAVIRTHREWPLTIRPRVQLSLKSEMPWRQTQSLPGPRTSRSRKCTRSLWTSGCSC